MDNLTTKDKVKAVIYFFLKRKKMFTAWDVFSVLRARENEMGTRGNEISFEKVRIAARKLWGEGFMEKYSRENINISHVERKIYLCPFVYFPKDQDVNDYDPHWLQKQSKKISG